MKNWKLPAALATGAAIAAVASVATWVAMHRAAPAPSRAAPDPNAVLAAMLADCGDGRRYSLAQAEAAVLQRAARPGVDQAQSMAFYLGSSCHPVDAAKARQYDFAAVLATRDSTALCHIAAGYGQLVLQDAGRIFNRATAASLFAACEARKDAVAAARLRAADIAETLERKVEQVHLP